MIWESGESAWVIQENLALIAVDTDLNDTKMAKKYAKNASGVRKNVGTLIGKECTRWNITML